ncbi:MAG: hypothetical protein E7269_08310 [Lachnospiraceae bacterium]|nr:hypothetical protein [Lachnospiraceae bacterium]
MERLREIGDIILRVILIIGFVFLTVDTIALIADIFLPVFGFYTVVGDILRIIANVVLIIELWIVYDDRYR